MNPLTATAAAAEAVRVTAFEKIKGIHSLMRVLNEDAAIVTRINPGMRRVLFPPRVLAGLEALRDGGHA